MVKILQNKKIIILSLLIALLTTTGLKCGGPPSGLTPGKPTPITLTFWKVWQDGSDIQDLIAQYQMMHPHISINFRNLTYDEYKNQILRAFAEDRGPDIFSVHTTGIREYLSLIEPLPSQIKMAYQVEKGTVKKETYTEIRTQNTLTLRDMRNLFPDVVYDNQIINNQIYGLPLSIDTLVLFYNRDLLNNAGIAFPPKTWNDFRDQVIKLTRQDFRGNLIQAGAAIGTADNVERSADILSLLMLQNGTVMTDAQGIATFHQTPPGYTRAISPAVEALNFYTSFASPAKQVYTWNENMPNSLTAFMSGQTAFFFGYSYHIPIIKAQAPKLNFEITEAPQIGTAVNFANYWVETVSKKSKNTDAAWDFILFITTNLENNKKFLEKNKKPTALRALISQQATDLELAPFANQLLTSRSWYKGRDSQAAEEIFRQMIRENLEGLTETEKIINLGATRVNQTR
ncbi:MAG TPA: extracellular solute-binding protein [Candidatus Uhrbacteria bacterium]|nr:extracellular solute-binding protein [Candidatus Uhrbacteria bacterium]